MEPIILTVTNGKSFTITKPMIDRACKLALSVSPNGRVATKAFKFALMAQFPVPIFFPNEVTKESESAYIDALGIALNDGDLKDRQFLTKKPDGKKPYIGFGQIYDRVIKGLHLKGIHYEATHGGRTTKIEKIKNKKGKK